MSDNPNKVKRIQETLDLQELTEMLTKERQDLITKAYPYVEERKFVEGRIIMINKRIKELQPDDPDQI
jgi:hypothetical protein